MTILQRGTRVSKLYRTRGWRRRQARAKALVWLLAPVVALVIAFQLQPAHVVLDIPVPRHTGGGDFWWERQSAQLAHADAWGVLHLYRQAGTAYPRSHGWHTAEEAFAYFDRWLTAHGWTPAGPGASTSALPESRVLAPANLRLYTRSRDRSERAHLAIWPIGGAVEGLHVVLVTSRPSWLRQLSSGLD